MKYSFKVFYWIVIVFGFFNVLQGVSYTSVIEGAELNYLNFVSIIGEIAWLRLFNFVSLVSYVILFYFLSYPLFGKQISLGAIALLMSTIWIPLIAKLGSLDLHLTFLQGLFFLSFLRYHKLGQIKDLIFSLILIGLSSCIGIWSSMVLAFGFWLAFKFVLKGEVNRHYYWVVLIPFFIGIFQFFQGKLSWSEPFLYFSPWDGISNLSIEFIAWQFWGILAFTLVLPALAFDLWHKIKLNDEWSMTLFIWVITSLIAGSAAAQFAFSILLYRQIQLYFVPNYPNKKMFKSSAIVFSIMLVIMGVLLLTMTYFSFGQIAFKKGIFVISSFWVMILAATVGLMSEQKNVAIIGLLGAGAMLNFGLWTYTWPEIEATRTFNIDVIEKMKAHKIKTLYLDIEESQTHDKLMWHISKNKNYNILPKLALPPTKQSAILTDKKESKDPIDSLEIFNITTLKKSKWYLHQYN